MSAASDFDDLMNNLFRMPRAGASPLQFMEATEPYRALPPMAQDTMPPAPFAPWEQQPEAVSSRRSGIADVLDYMRGRDAEAAAYDQRRRQQEGLRMLGGAVNQIGSAFDQRLDNIVVPNRPMFMWQPNVNPGIAGMAQQMLLAANRR